MKTLSQFNAHALGCLVVVVILSISVAIPASGSADDLSLLDSFKEHVEQLPLDAAQRDEGLKVFMELKTRFTGMVKMNQFRILVILLCLKKSKIGYLRMTESGMKKTIICPRI